MNPTVVLLLSDKRSGSTMFQRELCRHPEIQTVAYSPHTYKETHHWLKAAVLLDLDPSLFEDGRVYGGYGPRRNARLYLEDCILGNVADFLPPEDDRRLVFEGWETLCSRFAQPVFFEKSPQILAHWGCLQLILKWIEKTGFEVKILGLIRNPMSVMYSAMKLFHTDPVRRQFGWAKMYANLRRFQEGLRRDQFLLCRYEDSIAEPAVFFARVLDFIGVPQDERVGANVHSASVNIWKKDPFFTLRLDDSVKDMAVSFGYSEEELDNPEKDAPPLAYRLKQKIGGAMDLLVARTRYRFLKPMMIKRKLSARK